MWLMEAVRPATGWAHKLDINADDGDIRAAAKVQSAAYFYENSRLLGARGVMEKEAAQMGLDPLAAAAYRQAAYAAGVKKLCARATAEGVDVSRFAGAKQYRPEAVAARLCDKHFVARQMAKGFGRERENLLRSGFNGVHKRAAAGIPQVCQRYGRFLRRMVCFAGRGGCGGARCAGKSGCGARKIGGFVALARAFGRFGGRLRRGRRA